MPEISPQRRSYLDEVPMRPIFCTPAYSSGEPRVFTIRKANQRENESTQSCLSERSDRSFFS